MIVVIVTDIKMFQYLSCRDEDKQKDIEMVFLIG